VPGRTDNKRKKEEKTYYFLLKL